MGFVGLEAFDLNIIYIYVICVYAYTSIHVYITSILALKLTSRLKFKRGLA